MRLTRDALVEQINLNNLMKPNRNLDLRQILGSVFNPHEADRTLHI